MEVSVIITAEKDRGFLDDAIKSALNQSLSRNNYEIILASDGNPDLKRVAEKYKIGYAYQEHKGLSANLNNGVKQAKGKYIKPLPDDDMLTSSSLISLVHAIEKEKGDFVHGKAQYLYDTKNSMIYTPRDTHPNLGSLMKHNHISGGTVLYRKDVFDEVGGFDETLWTGEEFEFHLRLLSKGYKIAYVPDVVFIYRCHPGQKSRASKNKAGRRHRGQRKQVIDGFKRRYKGK